MKVEINGIEYGFEWGLGALELASDELDVSQDMIIDSLLLKSKEQQKTVVNLVLAGIRFWGLCQTPIVPVTLTYWQLLKFASDAPQQLWDDIINDFLHSKIHGQTILEAIGVAPVTDEQPITTKKKSRASVKK